MKGAGLAALASFLLFNVVQSTPWAMDEFQQGILMVIGLFSASVALGKVWPVPPKPRVIREYVEVPVMVDATEEVPPHGQNIPHYGTPNGPGNPDQGKPEHDNYGV